MVAMNVRGNCTVEPSLQHSERNGGVAYIRVKIATALSYKDEKPQYLQYTFFREEAERIANMNISKGSLLELTGVLESIHEYTPEGKDKIFTLRCLGDRCEYVNSKKTGTEAGQAAAEVPPQQSTPVPGVAMPIAQGSTTTQAAALAAPVPTPPDTAPTEIAGTPLANYDPQPTQGEMATVSVATHAGVAGVDATLGDEEDLPFNHPAV